MENSLDDLLGELLNEYTGALGVTFHSLELPISKAFGEHTDLLEKYKDIPMLSIDESFQTTFTYIIIDTGSVVIFFIDNLHFVSLYTTSTEPNKELAIRIFEKYQQLLANAIQKEHETQSAF